MDVAAFLADAPALFTPDGDVYGGLADPAYTRICDDVAGMTTDRELAVLNLAARHLPPGEAYLEVGSFKGRSICGASLGVVDRTFLAVENYAEFGMLGREAREELRRNVRERCADADVRLVEGDGFTLLHAAARSGVLPEPVGVYFYDGEHTKLAHYVALGVVEPLLADEALVLVDDASWPLVEAAHERFLADHPHWERVARWDARHNDDPLWANGLHAFRFRRPPGAPRTLSAPVRRALALQEHALGPARKAVWRLLHNAPWLVPLAKRLEPTSEHVIAPR